MKNHRIDLNKYLQFFGLFVTALMLFSFPLFASDVVFEADGIEYYWEKGTVEASGNIVAEYKGYDFTTDLLNIDVKQGQLAFPNDLGIGKDDTHVTANNFVYNYRNYLGNSKSIQIYLDEKYVSGQDIVIHPLFLEIKNATITSCGNEHPHLKLDSDTILVYPQFGYIVVWNSFLNLNGFPVLPIPTYVFGSSKYSVYGQASPFPEIGSSVLEGVYVRQKFGYILNEHLSGIITLGTSERLGGLIGVDQGFTLNASHSGHLNLSYVNELGVVGGVSYFLDLAKVKEVPDPEDFFGQSIERFSQSVALPLSRMSLIYQYKQKENEYWVNKKPLINLEINDFDIQSLGMSVSTKANFGLIGEENNNKNRTYTESWRSNIDLELEKYLYSSEKFHIKTQGRYYGFWYDTGATWQRLFADLSLDWGSGHSGTQLTFSKRLFDTGDSLFEYNKLDAQIYDELGFLVYKKFFGHEFGVEFYYVLSPEAVGSDNWQDRLRTLDVYTKLQFHCWKLVLRANTIRETAFNIGVELF